MPRYLNRRLAASLVLVSVGAADVVIGFKVSDSPSLTSLPATAAACWLVGGAMIGAGTFAPFKREWLGAFIGFFVGGAFTALVVLTIQGISA